MGKPTLMVLNGGVMESDPRRYEVTESCWPIGYPRRCAESHESQSLAGPLVTDDLELLERPF